MEVSKLDVSQLGEETKADVRAWALDEFTQFLPKVNGHLNTVRKFTLANISATALVAGMWDCWKEAVKQ